NVVPTGAMSAIHHPWPAAWPDEEAEGGAEGCFWGEVAGRGVHSARRLRMIAMHILGSIIIGLIVGVVAKLLMPGRDPGGFIVTALLGIAGSSVANFLGEKLRWYQEGETAGFIASVVGAVILLAIYRMV